ncbi:MAG TPA: hypothetical protein VFA52_02435 [Candidatus Paceibacterota bacterium]|nr:hypothetical protein [Candidatus Paceibacterota bacterium]
MRYCLAMVGVCVFALTSFGQDIAPLTNPVGFFLVPADKESDAYPVRSYRMEITQIFPGLGDPSLIEEMDNESGEWHSIFLNKIGPPLQTVRFRSKDHKEYRVIMILHK